MKPTPVRTCIHTLPEGRKCNGIALRDSPHCHHHHSHSRHLKRNALARTLDSPLGQNAAIAHICQAIYDRRIDHRIANSLLYCIQVSQNLRSK